MSEHFEHHFPTLAPIGLSRKFFPQIPFNHTHDCFHLPSLAISIGVRDAYFLVTRLRNAFWRLPNVFPRFAWDAEFLPARLNASVVRAAGLRSGAAEFPLPPCSCGNGRKFWRRHYSNVFTADRIFQQALITDHKPNRAIAAINTNSSTSE